MTKQTTPNQQKVLQALKEYFIKTKQSPTFKELIDLLKTKNLTIKSNSSLIQYLRILEKNNFIIWNHKARGIKLISENTDSIVSLPLLGCATCGSVAAYIDDVADGYIQISKKYLNGEPNKYFFIEAIGDSLNDTDEKIDEGNLVLIEKTQQLEENKIILAIINGLGTLKIYKKINGIKMLMPKSKNKEHKPIILHPEDDVVVCGKAVKVFNYKNLENQK